MSNVIPNKTREDAHIDAAELADESSREAQIKADRPPHHG